MRTSSERGAVAVEFALLLPVLLILLLGVVEMGRAFNAQISLTQAAREGSRVMAITGDAEQARTAAMNATVSLNPALSAADISVATFDPDHPDTTLANDSCVPSKPVRITISYDLPSITGFIGDMSLDGTGVMRCGG